MAGISHKVWNISDNLFDNLMHLEYYRVYIWSNKSVNLSKFSFALYIGVELYI